MSNQPFNQRLKFDVELSLTDPDNSGPQLVGTLTNEPVMMMVKNQTDSTVFFSDEENDENGTTMVAGEEIIFDCRGNHGVAVNMGFPVGTSFFVNVTDAVIINATGDFKISVLYAKQEKMSKIAVPVSNTNPAVPTHFTVDFTPFGSPSLTVTPVGNNVFFLDDIGRIFYNAFADNGIETTHISIDGPRLRFGLLGNATYNASTFNATPTDLAPISAGSDPKTIYVYGSVVAFSSDFAGGASASFSISFCVLTNGTNVDVVGASILTDFMDPTLLGIDVTIDTLNNIFFVVVQGLVGTEIHWEGTFDYRYVT